MDERNVAKRKFTYAIQPLRVILLLLSMMAAVAAALWSGAVSERRVEAKANPPQSERMMVLDKDGKSRVVELPRSPRPQFDEKVFDNPQMQSVYYRGRRIHFLVRNGWAIVDGDIVIGRASDLLTGETNSSTFAQHENMWLKVGSVFRVPYTVTSGNSNIPTAINYFNSTFSGTIQWIPRTTEADYVDFNFDPNDFSGGGFSALGRAGGSQQIGGSIVMSVSTLLHEMGHAVGLYHEQQRTDRSTYVQFHPENMSNALRWTSYPLADYFQLDGDIQNVGLYDYASVMHYHWNAFAKNDGPVFESIPSGIQITRYPPNDMTGDYSEGDIDGIKRLYDAAPSAITITSNPIGLQVIVDGATVTTPQTFNWALNSTHSLSVPSGGQLLGSKAFVYGRWNDNAAATHSITVTAGDGRRVSPQGKPATTVYSANFINLIKFTQSVFPAGTGSMTTTPAPQSYAGLPGVYFVARQPVFLQATPNVGQSFYLWFGTPLFSFSRNPQTYRWDTDIAEINSQAGFTNQPVYTFGSNLPDKRLSVLVDGDFWFAPINYSPAYDLGWDAGTTHSVDTFSPQSFFYFNTRYQFQNWSDGGEQLHDIILPADSETYTANFNSQFRASAETPCGGTVSISPFSADGFHNAGTPLSISQTPNTGFVFTGWRDDLTGTVSPQMVTLNDELYATANYNVNATPFSMTGLSPSSVVQNSAGFTLTINGTGFTNNRTFVFVNNQFRANTFISASQITVPVLASDLTTAGGISIFVQNFPDVGMTCAVYNNRTLIIKPAAAPTAAHVSVGGRVLTPRERGIFRARVSITDATGTTRTVYTNPFGYYNFGDVPAGASYVVSASHRRYNFAAQVLSLIEERDDVNFVALP